MQRPLEGAWTERPFIPAVNGLDIENATVVTQVFKLL